MRHKVLQLNRYLSDGFKFNSIFMCVKMFDCNDMMQLEMFVQSFGDKLVSFPWQCAINLYHRSFNTNICSIACYISCKSTDQFIFFLYVDKIAHIVLLSVLLMCHIFQFILYINFLVEPGHHHCTCADRWSGFSLTVK